MSKIVQLLCDLSEAPDTPFIADTIEPGLQDELGTLQRLGAVEVGPRPDTITCRACDSDHFAEVDFDPRTRRYFHSCPEAGIVWISGDDLATLRFNAEWLVDWLTNTLEISTGRSRRGLINGRAWHLGDATCGGTLMTVIFARRVTSQSELDKLASVLRPIHRAEKGVVITTSPRVARQVRLPGGYEFIDISEIVRSEGTQLMLDAVRLGYWIKGMEPTTAKGAPAREGRPTSAARVAGIFNLRRSRGEILKNDSAEAKAILAEWPQHASSQKPPNISTVRRHVSKLIAANGLS